MFYCAKKDSHKSVRKRQFSSWEMSKGYEKEIHKIGNKKLPKKYESMFNFNTNQ